MQDQPNELMFERKVIDCIASIWNPFAKNQVASLDLTVAAFAELQNEYSSEDILNVLRSELNRLENILRIKPGGLLAKEMQTQDRDAHWNCLALIEHLEANSNAVCSA